MLRKNKLALAVGVLGIASTPALALVNMTGAASLVSVKYAREIRASNASFGVIKNKTAGAISAGELTALVNLGVALTANGSTSHLYVRFELVDSATTPPTFATSPKLETDITVGVGTTAATDLFNATAMAVGDGVALPTTTVAAISGGVGESYVVFDLSLFEDGTGAITVPATTDIALKFTAATAAINFESTNSSISLRYSVYSTQAAAINPAGNPSSHEKLAPITYDYVGFQEGVAFSISKTDLIADVSSDFTQFKVPATNANSTGTGGSLGVLTLDPATGVLNQVGDDIVDTLDKVYSSISLVVTGDFSALQDVDSSGSGLGTFANTTTALSDFRVFLAENASCASIANTDADFAAFISKSTGSAIFDTATFDNGALGLAGNGAAANKYICIQRPAGSVEPLVPQTYTTEFKILGIGAFDHSNSSRSADLGEVKRDGTVLKVPYFTLTPGYISRFVFSNFSAADAPFTAAFQSDGGATAVMTVPAKAGNTVKAGTFLLEHASSYVTGFIQADGSPAGARGSATFTFVAPNDAIKGIYQSVSATGEVVSIPMEMK